MIKILQEPIQSFPIAFTVGFSINDLILWSVATLPSFCAQTGEDVSDSSQSTSVKWED